MGFRDEDFGTSALRREGLKRFTLRFQSFAFRVWVAGQSAENTAGSK